MSDFLHQQLPGLRGIYLFGSQAQQTAGPDSDIDLAVLVQAMWTRCCYGNSATN
ncbi:nucleotidyltransferase domain-containing protein [Salinispirillum marinum]|uniref:Nucleotidyltransferase domain-containing protein n=1 Tax=Salinispirillum marinum TaxID=1485203 RepID=A0ABV8BE72_9GAMM